MSEFRYNRLIAALLQHLARSAGHMEIDLTLLVPYEPARLALLEKIHKLLNKPFDENVICDSALIADLATFFAHTFWNQKLKEAVTVIKTKALLKYKVHGFEGEQTAGPYSMEEVAAQRNDIRGYEGVYDLQVEIVEVDENNQIIKEA